MHRETRHNRCRSVEDIPIRHGHDHMNMRGMTYFGFRFLRAGWRWLKVVRKSAHAVIIMMIRVSSRRADAAMGQHEHEHEHQSENAAH